MTRRNYQSSLAFVEAAFRACWGNANDLVDESKLLLDNGHTARAFSLSVLALEEIGKLCCADGLLFARANDGKAQTFAKSLKSHSTKLSALNLLPLLLSNIAMLDPRYELEPRFAQAIGISVKDLKNRGNAVVALLKGEGFAKLDHWKQVGFYAQPMRNGFAKPNAVVTQEMAQAAHLLAWRAVSTLELLLKDGNLERYIDTARRLRASISEADHEATSAHIEEMVRLLFSEEDHEEDEQSSH